MYQQRALLAVASTFAYMVLNNKKKKKKHKKDRKTLNNAKRGGSGTLSICLHCKLNAHALSMAF